MANKCVKCGNANLQSIHPDLYHYKISGLDDVYLKGGVTESICSKCGARSTKIKNIVGLHNAIASSLALARRRLTGKELRFLREQMAFSAEDLSQIVEYNEDYLRKIENGSQTPKATYEMFLRVAVLQGLKAPDYNLMDLAQREYKIQKLQFVNHDKHWEPQAA